MESSALFKAEKEKVDYSEMFLKELRKFANINNR